MSLGILEIYVILFLVVLATIGSILIKKHAEKYFGSVALLLFGYAGIFLFTALMTPPDLMSNFMLSIPTSIGFTVIIVNKMIRSKQ
jgi:hypothetical protein